MSSNYHGLLLVDKPSGMTSHDVVSKIRKIFKTKEVGHSGTLDPMASGLMVILLGEATKLSQYITDGDKAYEVGIRLGIETDTLDITGAVLKEENVKIDIESVNTKALQLSGEFNLPIPLYSAKKVDGKKLYEYARENIEIEVPQKKMKFWNVCKFEKSEEPKFSLECSKGSFIRSWVKLLGEKLEVPATMSSLRRTKSDHFYVRDAKTLEEFSDLMNHNPDQIPLIPLEKSLSDVKKIKVSGKDEVLMKNGQISHDLRGQLIIYFNPEIDQYIQIFNSQNKLLALISLEPEKGFKIRRIFNN